MTGQPHGASLGHPTLVTYSSSGPGGSVNGSHQYWYDDMGRATLSEDCVDGNCARMGRAYDVAGRLKYLHYPDPRDPDGENVKYTYDPAGHLTSVGSYLTGIDHDSSGRTTSQRYGNGLFEQRTYDPDRGWLDSQTLATGPQVPASAVLRDLRPRPDRAGQCCDHQQSAAWWPAVGHRDVRLRRPGPPHHAHHQQPPVPASRDLPVRHARPDHPLTNRRHLPLRRPRPPARGHLDGRGTQP